MQNYPACKENKQTHMLSIPFSSPGHGFWRNGDGRSKKTFK